MGTAEDYTGHGAAFFGNSEVVEAYSVRPGYPPGAISYVIENITLNPGDNDSPEHIRVLDAGCGNGLLTDGLINAQIQADIVAMDQSKAMVSAFRQRIPEGAVPIVGTFNRMPFRDKYLNLVTFGTALHWGDPDSLPQELYRVLRPGGIVASISNVTRANTEFTAILDELPGHAAKSNRMTADSEYIDLGVDFSFVGFKKFANDLLLTPTDFNRLLASIELFKATPPELASEAWQKMQLYAANNMMGDHVLVPFDTYVRISKAKLTTVGGLACQRSIGSYE